MKPTRHGLSLNHDGVRRSAFELLAYPEIGWGEVRAIWPELGAVDPSIAVHVEIDAKYDVYLKRQTADVDAFRRDEGLDPERCRLCRCAGAFQRSAQQARSRAAAHGRAGGPARRPDAGGAGDFGGVSAAGSAEEGCGRRELFHVKQRLSSSRGALAMKRSSIACGAMDCFVARAPRNAGMAQRFA